MAAARSRGLQAAASESSLSLTGRLMSVDFVRVLDSDHWHRIIIMMMTLPVMTRMIAAARCRGHWQCGPPPATLDSESLAGSGGRDVFDSSCTQNALTEPQTDAAAPGAPGGRCWMSFLEVSEQRVFGDMVTNCNDASKNSLRMPKIKTVGFCTGVMHHLRRCGVACYTCGTESKIKSVPQNL